MHLSDKKGFEWYLKLSWKNHFYAATHRQLKVHDENSDESSFTIIMKSEILDSEVYDLNRLNSIEKAIHQVIEEENRLNEILQAFTITAENALKQEEDHLEVKKDFKKFTS